MFTGAARIVDGNSCGFLERAISWQQTGPRGPAGEPGPVGPQGPAGNANIVVGHAAIGLLNPVAPSSVAFGWLPNHTFVAPTDGFCNLTISATQIEYTGKTAFNPTYRRDGGDPLFLSQTAVMLPGPRPGPDATPFDEIATGMTMDTLEVEAGHTYMLGVAVSADDGPLADGRIINFAFAWTCKFED